MRILSIETSCDETALAVLSVSGKKFKVEGHVVASQIALHTQYGGVFPMMAKREHSKNIVPLLIKLLSSQGRAKKVLLSSHLRPTFFARAQEDKLKMLLIREPELLEIFLKEIPKLKKPDIDKIAVTVGPGLEPALWVGINFAKALSYVWNIPIIPVNHMEGHVLSIFPKENKKVFTMPKIALPAISLLVSGGHTELVLIKGIGTYEIIGQTRDDAAGEAFDKVARMMELPYPGGPHISKLAGLARTKKLERSFKLPRPMIGTKDFDFSFSGLKTAVLYFIRDHGALDENKKMEIAREFEDAACDVLIFKALAAAKKYKAKNIIVGGGVSANKELARRLKKEAGHLKIAVSLPTKGLTTDNAIMIALAGYYGKSVPLTSKKLLAQGNLAL